jgi:putative endonuclease
VAHGSVSGMAIKDELGRYGEAVAARHLVEDGLTILAQNWRCREGELDIVALDGQVLVFCEVKTRSSADYGSPAEAVVGPKAARVRQLAQRWLQARRSAGESAFWPDIRFDVVSVLRPRQGALEVDHLRGAF